MENRLYDYSPIVDRPKLVWPGGARVAFYVGLNIEHFEIDKPSTSIWPGTADLVPDPLNYGWRDYGVRVGIWRMIETFDRYGIRPSVLLNSDVTSRYPQIIEAGRRRGWAWLAHGETNSRLHANLDRDEEVRVLARIVETIEKATGSRPKGWMGPGLTETFETPHLLRDLGLTYVLDWTADDQPFALNIPGMASVPYSVELNDIGLFVGKSFTGEDFYRAIVDQFDQLYRDGAQSGRVMALALHPFVTGQAYRAPYLARALDYISRHEGVWMTTSDEIAEHFLARAAGRDESVGASRSRASPIASDV
jgi:peptidoglycan/xylan/chitin deacetylase (PgdA/CDA1 family)